MIDPITSPRPTEGQGEPENGHVSIISWHRERQGILQVALVALVALIHAVISAERAFVALASALPAGCDVIHHLNQSIAFTRAFQHVLDDPGWSSLGGYLDLFRAENRLTWPGLHYLLPSIANAIQGDDPFWAVLANQAFWPILLLSTFFLGRRLMGGWAGLAAAVLVSLYPSLFGWSRVFNVDFPLTAMTALAICLLLSTRGLTSLPRSAALGLALGLGIMVKGQILLFVAGPALAVLASSLKTRRQGHLSLARPLAGAALATALALATSAIWWMGHLQEMLAILGYHVSDYHHPLAPIQTFSPLSSLALYLEGLALSHTGPTLALLLLLALPLAWSRPTSPHPARSLLATWVLVPLLLFSLMAIKFNRFLMPVAPALALITVSGLWRARFLRLPAAALACLAILELVGLTYRPEWYIALAEATEVYGWRPIPEAGEYTFMPEPQPYKGLVEEGAERAAEALAPGRYQVVGVIEDDRFPVTSDELRYLIRLRHPLAQVFGSLHSTKDFRRRFPYFDVLVRLRYDPTPQEIRAGPYDPSEPMPSFAWDRRVEKFARKGHLFAKRLEPSVTLDVRTMEPRALQAPGRFSALDYTRGNLFREPFGRFVLNGGEWPNTVEYDIEFTQGGPYELWIRYASDEYWPVMISLDGRPLAAQALNEPTGGWAREHLLWARATRAPIDQGRHTLRLFRQESMPHIEAIQLSLVDEQGHCKPAEPDRRSRVPSQRGEAR